MALLMCVVFVCSVQDSNTTRVKTRHWYTRFYFIEKITIAQELCSLLATNHGSLCYSDQTQKTRFISDDFGGGVGAATNTKKIRATNKSNK